MRSSIKSMLICFFYQKGIVHKESVSPGQTVNAAFYVAVLKRLQENVRRERPDQWRNSTWLLHHDNAPGYAALLTRWFLTNNSMNVVPHPPYSPNLAPSDFFLFPKLKMKLNLSAQSDEHCSSCCTLSLIRLYLDNIGSKCNRAASCLFMKELALLWCGRQLLEIISFFLCSQNLGFLFCSP